MAADDEHEPEHPLAAILFGAAQSEEAQRRHREAHEREAMARDDYFARLYGFLDELTPDQLVVLRSILNVGSRKTLQFIDGQVVSLLRRVHEVDPITGQKNGFEALLEQPPAPESSPDQ